MALRLTFKVALTMGSTIQITLLLGELTRVAVHQACRKSKIVRPFAGTNSFSSRV